MLASCSLRATLREVDAKRNLKQSNGVGDTAAILIRLPRSQKDALVAVSTAEHRTLNGTMRKLVDDYLAEQPTAA